MIPHAPLARVALLFFGLLSLAHLVIQVLGPQAWSRPTQVLLMPALALVLVTAARRPRGRLLGLALLALGFSWLGDSAPGLATGDTAFLLMVGFFLVAQVVFVVAFWPHRAESVLRRRRLLLVPYVAYVAALVWICAPHTGGLLVPVLLYGLLLGLMAVLATGMGPWVAAGGALFLVSDSLIALNAFAPGLELPQRDLLVMSTYIAAQTLIVLGLLRRQRDAPDREPARS
ncbi:lysoplasmalogenase family protein [Nocardiopsis sp. NPDC006938]|uniref:lysoplasmalogenase family protein n=1 Tax=Nocardiopsis sp. NPDC006938 TaxID=3364337 RepID=UPI0036BF723D